MEILSPSSTVTTSKHFSFHFHKTHFPSLSINIKFPPHSLTKTKKSIIFSTSHFPFATVKSNLTSSPTLPSSSITRETHHWIVLMEKPPQGVNSKSEVIDYYVKTLEKVLESKKEAQMCLYDASWDTHFGFCCDIDEEASIALARLPGVLSVKPDPDFSSSKKDYSSLTSRANPLLHPENGNSLLFPSGNSKHWLVRVDKPGIGVVTKAQMVDYYVQLLTKVLGNDKDAQMCIYNISWQSNFGFCCELDEECARELAGIPGVLSVHQDVNFEAENKDYGGISTQKPLNLQDSSERNQTTPVKTKKLFVTGLSFYTSEKTLRAAFEGFGELVEVKIIMDKISKRSKGYAFIEYTTEEAAAAALEEMNGKIINGWMIVVDVAKISPRKHGGNQSR